MSGLYRVSCHRDGPLGVDDEMQDSLATERELRGEEAPSPQATSAAVLWPSPRDVAGAPAARAHGKQDEQGLGATTAPQLGLLPSLLSVPVPQLRHCPSLGMMPSLLLRGPTCISVSCRVPGPWHHSAWGDINCDFTCVGCFADTFSFYSSVKS